MNIKLRLSVNVLDVADTETAISRVDAALEQANVLVLTPPTEQFWIRLSPSQAESLEMNLANAIYLLNEVSAGEVFADDTLNHEQVKRDHIEILRKLKQS